MKHIKTYMGVCFGSLLMTLSSCEPNMDYNNPLAENEATYYNTKEHLIYAVMVRITFFKEQVDGLAGCRLC